MLVVGFVEHAEVLLLHSHPCAGLAVYIPFAEANLSRELGAPLCERAIFCFLLDKRIPLSHEPTQVRGEHDPFDDPSER